MRGAEPKRKRCRGFEVSTCLQYTYGILRIDPAFPLALARFSSVPGCDFFHAKEQGEQAGREVSSS